MIIIDKSITVDNGVQKQLSWCEMYGKFYLSISCDPADSSIYLHKEEAIFLIEELTNFVNNKEK